jgi:hypothetical protein
MKCQVVTYRFHAVQQMFSRDISQIEVEEVLGDGEIIAYYPTDKPYPSVLLFKFVNDRPLHIVVSQDSENACYVITAYEPDSSVWESGYRTKRKP